MEIESDNETEFETDREKIPARSRVYDVEDVELNNLQPDTDDNPKDGRAPNIVDEQESEKTPENVNDDQDDQPSIR